MNKKLRKTIIIILAVIVGCGAVWGILTLVKSLNRKPVNVYAVNEVAVSGMYIGGSETYGSIYSDNIQKIMLSPTQSVSEIKVTEGQEVQKGDLLMTFDTSLGQLDVDKAEIEYERQKIELGKMRNYLATLESAQSSEALEARLNELENALAKEKASTPGSEPEMPALPLGNYTREQPYYMEYPDHFNIDETFEKVGRDDIFVVFVTIEGDEYVEYKGMHFTRTATIIEPEIPTQPEKPTEPEKPSEPESPSEPETSEPETSEGETTEPETTEPETTEPETTEPETTEPETTQTIKLDPIIVYSNSFVFFDAAPLAPSEAVITDRIRDLENQIEECENLLASSFSRSELIRMRDEQYRMIQSQDLSVRRAELDYRQKLAEVADGNIYANIDGIVTAVRTEEEASMEGLPIMEVSAGGGYYVQGTIGEFQLGDLRIGQTVQVQSWYTGMMYEGEVTEISTIPATENMGYSSGNNNITWYPFKVHILTDDVLTEGEYVGMTLDSFDESADKWYLESMFIRFDADKAYVYVKGENGLLEKRYVQLGAVIWGSYYEIKDGITMDDRIAFPYGKNVFDGAKTNDAGVEELYSY